MWRSVLLIVIVIIIIVIIMIVIVVVVVGCGGLGGCSPCGGHQGRSGDLPGHPSGAGDGRRAGRGAGRRAASVAQHVYVAADNGGAAAVVRIGRLLLPLRLQDRHGRRFALLHQPLQLRRL